MNPGFWLEPWHSPTTAWLVLAAACTSIACGVPGTFLVLQRMSLTGDAMSHSVLPGIVLGFVVSGSVDSPWVLAGAACSGWAAVMLVELISRKAGVREDAATGVVFTAMFSIGVILMQVFAAKIDLDPDCVLFGNLETAVHGARRTVAGWEVPNIVLLSGAAAGCALVSVGLAYHRLLAAAFDPMSSRLAGHAPARTQALLLGLTAWVVVAAFQSVGAIMAVALLVLPAATSLLVARRLPAVLGVVVGHSVLASVAGLYLATWAGCNMGAAVILSGAGLFVVTAVVTHRRAGWRA
jgi:manganese/zinc/iron transport system permease protein